MNKQDNTKDKQKDAYPTNEINISDYLVTESVDTNSLNKEKVNEDLSLLCKAEEKQGYKADISKGIANPQVRRAVSSLRLINPFKGY